METAEIPGANELSFVNLLIQYTDTSEKALSTDEAKQDEAGILTVELIAGLSIEELAPPIALVNLLTQGYQKGLDFAQKSMSAIIQQAFDEDPFWRLRILKNT